VETHFYLSEKIDVSKDLAGRRVVRAELAGLSRRPRDLLRNLAALWRQLQALSTFLRHMRRHRPAVAVGFGSYASAPGMLAAALLRVPLLLHEQNAVPGLTNRLLGRLSDGVAVAFPETAARFAGRECRVVGNPVRRELLKRADRGEALRFFGLRDGVFTLAVVGGSQGAQSLNRCLAQALTLFDESRPIQVIHATGRDKFEAAAEAVRGAGPGKGVTYRPLAYVDRMEYLYAAADLLVCRAGASTLAEIALQGKASVLVPYPLAAGGHQEANARAMEKRGAALVLEEKELGGEKLYSMVSRLMDDKVLLEEMEGRAGGLGVPDSASRLAGFALELAGGVPA
jgi:UDP-N-acetylglucosamine--N-acetylmuramyl-(pentapeptide) pyrophosphoryl-undecaprenol N-acetylglucosamine transferase